MGELAKREEKKLPLAASTVTPEKQRMVTAEQQKVLTSVLVTGDLSKLDEVQKWVFYEGLCARLGLDPFTRPFKIIKAQGKEVLYADATLAEQLAALRGLTVEPIEEYVDSKGNLVIKVKVYDQAQTRFVVARGIVVYDSLAGEAAANAQMKCETKAFRRGVLKFCGLSEVQDTDDAPKEGVQVDITEPKKVPPASIPRKSTAQKEQAPPPPQPPKPAEPEVAEAEVEEDITSADDSDPGVDADTGEVYTESAEEFEETEAEHVEEQQEAPKTTRRRAGW